MQACDDDEAAKNKNHWIPANTFKTALMKSKYIQDGNNV